MRISTHFICSLLVLMLVFQICPGQKSRDLSRYDDGGAIDYSWDIGPDAHPEVNAKLRDFLWEHWTQKRLAHVVVTFYTIEGDPTKYNLFVEPDGSHHWRVSAKYGGECCAAYALYKPKRKRERFKGTALYDVVERVQPSKNDGDWIVIPEDDRRKSTSYNLRLRRIIGKNKSRDALLIL